MARLKGNKASSTWQIVLFFLIIVIAIIIILYRKRITDLFEGTTSFQLVKKVVIENFIFIKRQG